MREKLKESSILMLHNGEWCIVIENGIINMNARERKKETKRANWPDARNFFEW